MHDAAKNFIIGIFVIIAIAIVIFILMFLNPTVGDEGKTLHVRFTNIDKINKGTRVNFAGKPVGEVVKIEEIKDARIDQEYRNGGLYIYELTLKIDSGIDVFDTDDFSIRTSGLLGERSIEITPQPFKPNQFPREVTVNEVIFATSPDSIEEAISAIKEIVNKVGDAFDGLTEQIEVMKNERILEKISTVADNVIDITNALNRPDELDDIIKNAHAFSASLKDLGDSVNNSWPKVDATLDSAYKTVNKFHEVGTNFNQVGENGKAITSQVYAIVDHIGKGGGTVGQLLMNDEITLKLGGLLSKAHTLMNDVNHYGLLFHVDKGWQRLRARRANLLQCLSTPQQFRNFFQDEVDNISTSLSRVAMVLQDTEDRCGPLSMANSREFVKVYAELLQYVTGLEENLKIYNQQLADLRMEMPCDCSIAPQSCENSAQVPWNCSQTPSCCPQ